MSTADAVAGVLWVGVTLYAVFGGADFGAGFWSLLAGGGERGRRARALIDWAIGPVWEANHVWLIFVLVVLWTAFSTAFAAIFSTLFIPLSLAALGIVLRGAGFAFHRLAPGARERRVSQALFGLSSLLTPFFMGTVVGAIASGRVPLGNAEGDAGDELAQRRLAAHRAPCSWPPAPTSRRSSWSATPAGRATPSSSATSRCAPSPPPLWPVPSRVAGIFVFRADARYIYDGLVGEALPLVILSARLRPRRAGAACGGARSAAPARSAIGAVAAVIWGWGVAQYPYLLPQTLTITDGAAGPRTLTEVLIVFGVAVVLVLPALGLLYVLSQRSLLEE